MGEAKKRGTKEERVAQARARKGSIVITSPFTGKSLEETPSGMSLKGITFHSREEAQQFMNEHWDTPVEMRGTY